MRTRTPTKRQPGGPKRGARTPLARRGFTLVELLVVITIIGILVALLLPAVQAARESARRVQCQNNLKQLSLGMLDFESANGRYPSGGWGYMWVGDPDRGLSAENQPGGWAYQILPYIEQQNLFALGAGLAPAGQTSAAKSAALLQLVMSPLSVHNCPSRRPLMLFPFNTSNQYNSMPNMYNTSAITTCARTDYAANCGYTTSDLGYGNADISGPSSLAIGDQWTATNGWHPPNTTIDVNSPTTGYTGICFLRSKITTAHVTDGTSNTFLVGEKYMDPDDYYNGVSFADDQTLMTGFDNDNHRATAYQGSPLPPAQDQAGIDYEVKFGSVHAGSYNMAFCDGSIHAISYAIDPMTHQLLGSRADGLPIDATKF